MSLLAVKHRYVMAIGGDLEDETKLERFARLDSLKLNKGWKILHLASKSLKNLRFQAAFILENPDSETVSFMICGGMNINDPDRNMKS